MENKEILDVGGKFKIEFDEEKQCIVISTPEKNVIEISDSTKHIRLTDQHKNEIVMDKNGITLNSCQDIILNAKRKASINAMQTSVTAKSDVSVEGTNVKVNAKVSATVKGNATAELSASGQTIVKGAMVMIN